MNQHIKLLASLILLLAVIAGPGSDTAASAQTLSPVQTFSSNGTKLFIQDGVLSIGNIDISVWNNTAESVVKIVDISTGFTQPIAAIHSRGGLFAVTSNGPNFIRKWHPVNGGNALFCVPATGNSHDDAVTDMVVISNGVFTSSDDGTIKRWHAGPGTFLGTMQTPIGPDGFVTPIRKMTCDRSTNRLYASFGRYKALDGVGRATLLPSGDFENITTENQTTSTGVLGRKEVDGLIGFILLISVCCSSYHFRLRHLGNEHSD